MSAERKQNGFRARHLIAWLCLAAVVGFAGLDAVHGDDYTAAAPGPTTTAPCRICQLAASARPVIAHVQAPLFVAITLRLVCPEPAVVPARPVLRISRSRPPPAASLLSFA